MLHIVYNVDYMFRIDVIHGVHQVLRVSDTVTPKVKHDIGL